MRKLSVQILYLALFLITLVSGYFIFQQVTHPKTTSAEIATSRDWIGIFATNINPNDYTDVTSYRAASADGGTAWNYVNCTKTSANPPLLSGSCNNFTAPATPGAYEFRFHPNNAKYIMNLPSNTFWVMPATNPTFIPQCSGTQQPYVDITWGSMAGVTTVQLIRNGAVITNLSGNSFSDVSVAAETTYTYQIRYISSTSLYKDFPSPAVSVTTLKCIRPFIQTTGGDVHSNDQIDTPGGPRP